MKKIGILAIALVLLLALATTPVLAKATKVVTPDFEDHGITGAVTDFSTATTLGSHSVRLRIPQASAPGAGVYNLGLNAEVTTPGVVGGLGLSRHQNISFKAKLFTNQPNILNNSAPLYVAIILYDRTNGVWVSLIPTDSANGWGPSMTFSDPVLGWRTATPGSDYWIAWAFDAAWRGSGFPGNSNDSNQWPGIGTHSAEVMTLEDWDNYIDAQGINAKVKKLNIQFGYQPGAWGRAYVDALTTHGFVLDFEP